MIFSLVLAVIDDALDRIADTLFHIDDIFDDWWDEEEEYYLD